MFTRTCKRSTQYIQGSILYTDWSAERTMPNMVLQSATQANNNVPRNLETHPPPGPEVEFSPVEYQTMGNVGTVHPSPYDTQLMGPLGYTTYPAGAFSYYVGSGNYD